jgi:hypothetical protein
MATIMSRIGLIGGIVTFPSYNLLTQIGISHYNIMYYMEMNISILPEFFIILSIFIFGQVTL